MKSILLFILFTSTTFAETKKPVLMWAFPTSSKALPPPKTNILDAKHPLFKLYHDELADYDQQIMAATITRIEADMKSKRLICYPGSSEYTRRRSFAYLTSQYIQPAPQLIMTEGKGKELMKKFGGHVTLKKVIQMEGLKGSLAEGRSFGETIDRILASQEAGNYKRQVYNTFIQTVTPQIKNGRVDYTLEYPFVVQAMEKEDTNGKVRLMIIPLEDAEHFVTQYTACSKTPEGLAIIKRLDKIVKKNVSDPNYWKGVMDSIEPKDRAEFQKHIDKFIVNRSKESVVID